MGSKDKLLRIQKLLFIVFNYACSYEALKEIRTLVQELIDEV